MTALQQVKILLANMSFREKAELVNLAIGSGGYGFPGIERTPGVCGGSACIVRTRIPVWSLVAYRKLGVSDAVLLENFPTLRAQDLHNAWNYYAANTAEIEEEIKENNED